MHDSTPPPYGDVTRRWTALPAPAHDRHVRRFLEPGACPAPAARHVERPADDAGACYRQLVPAAVAGDPIATGWLATSHRPLLVVRGRALLEHDPGEWGAVCLELLHTTLAATDPAAGRWMRRHVAQRLASKLSRVVARHLARRQLERPTEPAALRDLHQPAVGTLWDPDPGLGVALDRALDRLDPATRDALYALADRQPLAAVAADHHLSHDAVRQRVTRARRRLRPELAAWWPAA